MAGNAVIKIEYDISSALDEYKKLIDKMAAMKVDNRALASFESSFSKLQQKAQELNQLGLQGFTSSKQISDFNKQITSVSNGVTRLSAKLSLAAKTYSSFGGSETGKIQSTIKTLESEITQINTSIKSSALETLKAMGMSSQQLKDVKKRLQTEEQIRAVLQQQAEETVTMRENAEKEYQSQIATARTNSNQTAKRAAVGSTANIMAGQVAEQSWFQGDVINFGEKMTAAMMSGLKQGMTGESLVDLVTSWLTKNQAGVTEEFKTKFKDMMLNTLNSDSNYQNFEQSLLATTEVQKAKAKLNQAELAVTAGNPLVEDSTMNVYLDNMEKMYSEISTLTDKINVEKGKFNQAAIQDAAAQKTLEDQIKKTNESFAKQNGAAQASASGLYASKSAAEQTEKEFKNLIGTFTRFFSLTSMFNTLRNQIKKTFNDIRNLDKAYASIAYVTNETVKDLWATYNDYASMAEKLGQSTVDVVKASAIYRQQGLDTQKALELTTDTMKLATIAGNDYSKATQEMTAALRGFKMEMDEGSHVSDVYSELAAHAAASVDGIAQAMSRTASIANSAGMSFENTSAFLTQMIETTQETAENIGTSMKTIIARFTELKQNVAGTAESEFQDLNFNKVDEALKSVGVSLKDTQGQFRNLDEVFLELSAKWDTLDRNTQRYIATIAAGSRQQSRFIAMMDNYERTAELIDIAADSAGKTEEQFSKAADTLDFKINALKTKWEEFRLSFTSSDFAKGLVDGVSETVSALKDSNKLALVIAIPFAITFMKGFFSQVKETLQTNVTAMGSIGDAISDAINKKITFGTKKGIQLFNRVKEEEQYLNEITKKINNLKQTTSNGVITLFNKVDHNKFSAALGTLHKELLKGRENIKLTTLSEEEQTKALTILREELKGYGLETEQVTQLLEIFKNSTLEEMADMNNVTNQIQTENVSLEAQEAALKKANQEWNNYQIYSQAISKAMSSTFSTMANSAGMFLTTLIGIGDLSQSLSMTWKMLAGQAINSAFAIIPAIKNRIAAGMKEKTVLNEIRLLERQKAVEEAANNTKRVGEISNEIAALKAEDVVAKQTAASAALAGAAMTAGISIAVTALVALASSIVDSMANAKTDAQIFEERMKAAEEASKTAKENVKTQETEIKNAKELMKKYDDLSSRTIKTKEEQEEYNKLIEDIKEKFPEVVNSYGEAADQVKIQREQWEQIVALQEKSLNFSKKGQVFSDIIEKSLERERIEKEKEREQEENSKIVDFMRKKVYPNPNNQGEVAVKSAFDALTEFGISPTVFQQKTGLTIDKNTKLGDIYGRLDKDQQDISFFTTELQKDLDEKYSDIYDATLESLLESITNEFSGIIQSGSNASEKKARALASKNYVLPQTYDTESGYKQKKEEIKENLKKTYGENSAEDKIFDKIEESRAIAEEGIEHPGKDTDNGYVLYPIGKMVMGGSYDNLPEWLELQNDTRQILESIGIKQGKWEEIRYDDEEWKKVGDQIEGIIIANAALHAMEYAQSPQFDKQLSDDLENGKKSEKDIEEIFNREQYKNDTGAQAYKDQLLNRTRSQKKQLEDIGMKNLESLSQEQIKTYANTLDSINNLINKNGEKVNIKDALKLTNNDDIEKYLKLFTQFDFSKITPLNAAEQKENGIALIKSIFGEPDAEDIYNNLLGAFKNPQNEISIGIIEEFQTKAKKIEEAFEKNGKVFQKVIEGDGKLAVSEISSVDKALEEFNKEAGTSFKLSDYYQNGIFDRLKFKKDLQDTIGDIKNFGVNARKALALKPDGEEKDALEQAIKDFESYLPSIIYQTDIALGQLTEAKVILEEIDNLVSNTSSAISQFISDGYVNSKSLQSLAETLGSDFTNNIKDYVNEALQLNVEAINKYVKAKIEEKEAILESNAASKEEILQLKALQKEYENKLKEQEEQRVKKEKEYTDALKARADAEKGVADAQEKLNDAIKAYNDLLYGSENRKSSLDLLYNYQQALSQLNDEMSRSKDLLEDSKSFNEASKNLKQYLSSAHKSLAEYAAQNEVLKTGLQTRKNNLLNGGTNYNGIQVNFGDYVRIDEQTGLAIINQRLLQEARFANKWKDQLESFVDDYNKYSQELLKNEDEMRKIEKEIQEMRMEATQKWADFESDIAETLKNEYQEQVDLLKEKYESMKDADDDYVDALQEAIEKQRKLREKEKKWEDLATKQKKLSLMSRDTSGSNQIDKLKLEKEIKQDQENMLDDSIDSLIDEMQKLYEKEDEIRQAEIELKEALLDDALYWNMTAQNVAQSFNSVDEFLSWSVDHHREYLEMTDAQKQAFLDEETKKFNEAAQAAAILARDQVEKIESEIETSADEVNDIIKNTSEVFTTEVERIMAETEKAMDKEIDDAIKKIEDAKEALNSAYEKLEEAAKKVKEIAETLNGIQPFVRDADEPAPDYITGAARDARMNSLKADLIGGFTDDEGNTRDYTKEEFLEKYSSYKEDAEQIWNMYSEEKHRDSRVREQIALTTAGADATIDGDTLRVSFSPTGSNYGNIMKLLETYGFTLEGNIGSSNYPVLEYYKQYKQGGLVDYTGPAWVDGTKKRPEAFLNADDTELIGRAVNLLHDIPALNPVTNTVSTNTSYGDTNVSVYLNIDHISSDIDIDDMLERVDQHIVDVARPIGTNVVLQQRI